MLKDLWSKMIHPVKVEYKCTGCQRVFGKKQKACPHCGGGLVEVLGTVGQK